MLAYIEGRLLEKSATSCVLVTASGLGYEVFIPSHTALELPNQGEQFFLYLAQIVREDAQEIFGFETWEERETFKMLITINRVGARTALAILSAFRPYDLRQLVARDDALALTQVSGIGKQTGQKIFLELKYKFKDDLGLAPQAIKSGASPVYNDALTGLVNLGYEEKQVSPILKEILEKEPDLDVAEALRAGLKAMAKSKQ